MTGFDIARDNNAIWPPEMVRLKKVFDETNMEQNISRPSCKSKDERKDKEIEQNESGREISKAG